MRYGGSYYPKLQSCVPFTPVTGPRLMVRQTDRESGTGGDNGGSGGTSSGSGMKREAVVGALCEALKQVAEEVSKHLIERDGYEGV